ncbi:MAG: HEPN domain-containing protein [Phycisphaerae bacterium]|jgi:HEPN domain-containing protein
MNAEDFYKLMVETDKVLAKKEIPAAIRVFHAYGKFRGPGSYEMNQEIDPAYGPYEGSNLLSAINDWYKKHYPPESIHVKSFGKRPVLIRGEIFLLNLPPAFNIDPETIPVSKNIEGITEGLLQILDNTEIRELQNRFNLYFMQASRLELLCIKVCDDLDNPNKKLIQDLFFSAYGELNSASRSVIQGKPSAYIWCIQQAVEKFFKAYLAFAKPEITAEDLRKNFGHNLQKLVKETCIYREAFKQVLPHIELVDISPDMRYKPPKLTLAEAIEKIDIAHKICDLIVRVFLSQIRCEKIRK